MFRLNRGQTVTMMTMTMAMKMKKVSQVSCAVDDVSRRRKVGKTSIGDSGGEEKFRRGPGLVSPRRSQQDDESQHI